VTNRKLIVAGGRRMKKSITFSSLFTGLSFLRALVGPELAGGHHDPAIWANAIHLGLAPASAAERLERPANI